MYTVSLRSLLCVMLFLCLHSYVHALKPSKVYQAVPDTMHLPYEKNTLITPDNVQLKSWTFLPANGLDKKITLVIAYADAGNMSWYLSQAAILSQVGYTVILFDYRGFGESDDFTIDPKMLYYDQFVTDLETAMTFARNKYPGNKTGIWCFSMGTIITTLAAQTAQPDFIIGDSYVTDPVKIKEHFAKDKEITMPAATYDYSKTLYGIKAPMLLFSGEDDKVTPQEPVMKLKQEMPNVSVVSYKGDHMHGFSVLSKTYLGSEYVGEINKFLKVE